MSRKQLTTEEKKKKITININENMINKIKKISAEKGLSISQFIENIIKEK
ncbi:DUF6364 family protein [bacterium]|jgi:predicted DNA binding CopG/RHH family protein|nr:DUF6364 family protein [bacterium]